MEKAYGKFGKVQKKKPPVESIINEAGDLCLQLYEKRLDCKCFLVKIAKILLKKAWMPKCSKCLNQPLEKCSVVNYKSKVH